MTTNENDCKSAVALLDLEDLEAAIELGNRLCQHYAICPADKGGLIFDLIQKFLEVKARGQAGKEEVDVDPISELSSEKGLA